MQKQEPVRSNAANAVGIENRFVSQTAPAYNNSNHPQYRNGRAPTTKVGGTVTRRTNNPVRRTNNNESSLYESTNKPLTAPPMIAVTGMGGLRVLKANGAAAGAQRGGKGGSGRR